MVSFRPTNKLHSYDVLSDQFLVKVVNLNLLLSIMTKQTLGGQQVLQKFIIIFEPGHEKMCFMPYANNKGADQPAHPRSLISAFIVRCLYSMISLDSIAEISRL